MSKYIETDKVLMALRLDHKDVIYIDKNDTARRIEKIQGIDLVRCKECTEWNIMKDGVGKCDAHLISTRADDFCSYGEREGE